MPPPSSGASSQPHDEAASPAAAAPPRRKITLHIGAARLAAARAAAAAAAGGTGSPQQPATPGSAVAAPDAPASASKGKGRSSGSGDGSAPSTPVSARPSNKRRSISSVATPATHAMPPPSSSTPAATPSQSSHAGPSSSGMPAPAVPRRRSRSGSASSASSSSSASSRGSAPPPAPGATPAPKRIRPPRVLKRKPLRVSLERVLTQLQRRDTYGFFLEPVNPDEVPDYTDVVKEPMDLATMEKKLHGGVYRRQDEFQRDLLLVTGNAQTFNPPGSIYSNEAARLERWGVRAIARECGAAILPEEEEAEAAAAAANAAGPSRMSAAKARARSSATPRIPGTPGVKQEEGEEEGEGDDADGMDWDGSDGESSTGGPRDRSVTATDRFRMPDGSSRIASPETLRRRMQLGAGRGKKAKNKGGAPPGFFGSSGPGTPGVNAAPPPLAAVTTTSNFAFENDGSIDLDSFTAEEKRSLLQPLGLDTVGVATSGLLLPRVESIVPLHPTLQPRAGEIARQRADLLHPLQLAMSAEPQQPSASYSHDVASAPDDQKASPFTVPTGWGYGPDGVDPRAPPKVPLAWPRPHDPSMDAYADKETGRFKIGRERAREREALGITNLDDWTYPRAFLSRLLHPLDLGLFPGLIPSSWQAHIRSSAGGAAVTRLPPFELTEGATIETALREDIASASARGLFGSTAQAMNAVARCPPGIDSNPDVVGAIVMGSATGQFVRTREQVLVAGLHAADKVRERVWGGPSGEAYMRSLDEFVRGAAAQAQERDDERDAEDAEEELLEELERAEEERLRAEDEAAEARRREREQEYGEGGIARLLEQTQNGGITESPARGETQPPGMEEDSPEAIDESVEPPSISYGSALQDATMRGTVLDRPLVEWVRDEVADPITGGLLQVLVRAGELVQGAMQRSRERATPKSEDPPRKKAKLHADPPKDAEHLLALVDELEAGRGVKSEDGNSSGDAQLLRDLVDVLPPAAELPTSSPAQAIREGHILSLLDQQAAHARSLAQELKHASSRAIEVNSLLRNPQLDLASQAEQNVDSTLQPASAASSAPPRPLRVPDAALNSAQVTRLLAQYARLLPGLSERASGRRERSSAPAYAHSPAAEADKREQERDAMLWDELRLAYAALARNTPPGEVWRPQPQPVMPPRGP